MPDFVARFFINEGSLGFPAGKLVFGESGVVGVPTRHDDSNDRATIGIHWKPNTEILNGEEFEAECSVLAPEYWQNKIKVGYKFMISHPSDMAIGEIVRVL